MLRYSARCGGTAIPEALAGTAGRTIKNSNDERASPIPQEA
jgi:hypothetical protein